MTEEEADETPSIGGAAIEVFNTEIFPEFVGSQALEVDLDAVAGATSSGNGIKGAIEDALVNGAGVDASLLYQPMEKSDALVQLGSPEDPYNILVVGFGGSGMAAALSAIQHTNRVIAIEMNGKLGGNTATASGPMGINPQSKISLNGGLPFEDEEELLADWLEHNGFSFGNPTSFLTRFVCSQSFQDYSLDHVAVAEDFDYAAGIFKNLGGGVDDGDKSHRISSK